MNVGKKQCNSKFIETKTGKQDGVWQSFSQFPNSADVQVLGKSWNDLDKSMSKVV